MGVAKYTKDERGQITDVTLQSGIHVKPFYGPEDLERVGFSYDKDLADPGLYPFTRAIHPQGYRSRAWTTRQYTGFGTPYETNEKKKKKTTRGPPAPHQRSSPLVTPYHRPAKKKKRRLPPKVFFRYAPE